MAMNSVCNLLASDTATFSTNRSQSGLQRRGCYRFGFNGQEMDNEISGLTGTHTTAEFWEYDSRLGRRWNLDPVVKDQESPYLCFGGNPVYYADPDGLDKIPKNKARKRPRYHTRKVKNAGAPTTNTNSAGQRYGKGIWYWLTDAYNDLFNDNAAHKVRSGRYVTSPWTQVPQTAQNGNWTSHRFSGPQYNPNDYRLRNTRISVVSNDQWNVFALLSGSGLPINYGAGSINPDLNGAYDYNSSGAISGMLNALAWINGNLMLGPSRSLLGPINGIIIPILVEAINSAMVNPVFRRTNSFRAYSNNSVGGTSHTVWIRYRRWQAGFNVNILSQAIRRILYGFNGNR